MKSITLFIVIAILSCHCHSKAKQNPENKDLSVKPRDCAPPISDDQNAAVQMKVCGEKKDNVHFFKNNIEIGSDRTGTDNLNYQHDDLDDYWDGTAWRPCGNIIPCRKLDTKVSDHDGITYISVRCGRERDKVYGYAVVGNQVFRSRLYDVVNSEHGAAVSHVANSIRIIGPGAEGTMTFNGSWSYESIGNAGYSTQPQEQDKILTVLP